MGQHELRSITIAAGQKQGIELKNLPDGRATHIVCELAVTVANSDAVNDISCSDELVLAAVSEVLLESPLYHLRADGRGLRVLYQAMRGKASNGPSAFSVPKSSSLDFSVFMYVPMADPHAEDPNFGAQDCRLLKDKNLDVRFGSLVLSSDLTITAGNIYPTIHYTEGAGIALPSEVNIGYEDWNQKTANLPEGSYANLVALHQTAGTDLTPTLVERVRLQDGDGGNIIDSIRFQQLVQDFNDKFGVGSESATEYLLGSTAAFLPVITAPDKYKVSQLPHSDGSARADITGTATGVRFIYRMIVPTERSTENTALKKFGVMNPERVQMQAKTMSKTPLVGDAKRVERLRRILPKRPAA